MKELLGASTLAFAGTVQAVGQSNVAGLPIDDRTVIVHVEQVLQSAPAVDIGSGSQVTVQLSEDRPPLGVGERATFFTNPTVYGEYLAVTEVGRTAVEAAQAGTALGANIESPLSAVDEALAEIAQDAVVSHAQEADAIVRGRVVGLNQALPEPPPGEHDPRWWIATLETDVVAKGDLPDLDDGRGRIDVLYANSIDIQWRRHPKPKAGQAGLWLLHRTDGDLARLAPFQLLHPEDLQPSVQLEDLRDRGIVSTP